ncbi:MAG TPA: phosphocholine cytidylyltransferase family protein [Myxococcota bacterium]|nr:phosphocholine cytidylyltransferase family protein [Myxococcota bacterium]
MKALILAAGVGSRLRPRTNQLPKTLVAVNGKPIMGHILDALQTVPLEEIVIVSGYLSEKIVGFTRSRKGNFRIVKNNRFRSSGNGYSLLLAREQLAGSDFFKIDADLIFDAEIATGLLAAPGDVRLVVELKDNMGAEEMKIEVDRQGNILDISKEIPPARAWGESIGIEFCTAAGGRLLFAELESMIGAGLRQGYYEEAYARLARKGAHVTATRVMPGQHWIEIDDERDLQRAKEMFPQRRGVRISYPKNIDNMTGASMSDE